MTLDLGGKTLAREGRGYALAVDNGANVTLKNGSVTSPYRAATVRDGATLTIESGTFNSGDCGIEAASGGHIVINGGDFTAQEFGVIVFDEGTTVEINDGEFSSIDNAVIGGNGSAGRGGTTMTINGGTFHGGITSSGYIACGIYHPQDGTLIVNGGTFDVTNGVGILVRGGDVTINDVTINTTGEVQGKVGDSRVLTTCSALYIDGVSTYPGWTNCYTTVKGGTFNSEAQAVTVTVPEGEDKADRLAIEGGVFNGETNPSF